MKRDPALIPLSREHHKLLLLAQVCKRNGAEYKGMPTDLVGKVDYVTAVWEEVVSGHLAAEEQVLFPSLAKYEPLKLLCDELLAEHYQLNLLFESLSKEATTEALDKLGRLLEAHVRKEERVLFQEAQGLLATAELKVLGAQLAENKERSF